MQVLIDWNFVVALPGKEIIDSFAEYMIHSINCLFHAHSRYQVHPDKSLFPPTPCSWQISC